MRPDVQLRRLPRRDPKSTSHETRIASIARCMDELERLRECRGAKSLGERMGVTVGECDWLEELHGLLHGYVAGSASPRVRITPLLGMRLGFHPVSLPGAGIIPIESVVES